MEYENPNFFQTSRADSERKSAQIMRKRGYFKYCILKHDSKHVWNIFFQSNWIDLGKKRAKKALSSAGTNFEFPTFGTKFGNSQKNEIH